MASYSNGVITIPAWQVVRVVFDPARLRSTVLHEFGHAFSDRFERQLRRRGLVEVFGDPEREDYPDDLQLMWNRWGAVDSGFVSSYAASHPEEDIAETFRYVVEHDLAPPRVRSKRLRRKLEFMSTAIQRIFWGSTGEQAPLAPSRRTRMPRPQRPKKRIWGRSRGP